MTTFETQLKEKLGEHNQNEVNIKITNHIDRRINS